MPAYPSRTDIRLSYYPDVLYFYVPLMDERAPSVKAFHIRDGQVSEEPIALTWAGRALPSACAPPACVPAPIQACSPAHGAAVPRRQQGPWRLLHQPRSYLSRTPT